MGRVGCQAVAVGTLEAPRRPGRISVELQSNVRSAGGIKGRREHAMEFTILFFQVGETQSCGVGFRRRSARSRLGDGAFS